VRGRVGHRRTHTPQKEGGADPQASRQGLPLPPFYATTPEGGWWSRNTEPTTMASSSCSCAQRPDPQRLPGHAAGRRRPGTTCAPTPTGTHHLQPQPRPPRSGVVVQPPPAFNPAHLQRPADQPGSSESRTPRPSAASAPRTKGSVTSLSGIPLGGKRERAYTSRTKPRTRTRRSMTVMPDE
jgi:hypothetical protein